MELCPTRTARVAVRRYGRGPALVFLHGWPLTSFTFRRLLPHLAARFECILIDEPGAGDTEWTEETDFSWPGQAATVKEVLDGLGLGSYFIFGQDSGAMIGRHLALLDAARAKKMIMTNTEMPNHRPPWIRLYRLSMFIPGTDLVLRQLLRSRAFLRSRWGFGNSFHDLERLDDEFQAQVLAPLIHSARRMAGQNRFLRGWSWSSSTR